MENKHYNTTYETQFSSLMSALGARLGADALEENTTLKNDPSAVVPEPVRRHCMEVIARYGTTVGYKVRRIVLRIAVAALIALLLLATAFAVSPTLREKTIAFIQEVFDTHTEFRTTESASVDLSDFTIEVGWLPEGMKLVEDYCGKIGRVIRYESIDALRVHISIYTLDTGALSIDSEYADAKPILIQGHPASLIVNENSCQVIIENHVLGLLIRLSGEKLTTDAVLLISERLKFSQK